MLGSHELIYSYSIFVERSHSGDGRSPKIAGVGWVSVTHAVSEGCCSLGFVALTQPHRDRLSHLSHSRVGWALPVPCLRHQETVTMPTLQDLSRQSLRASPRAFTYWQG